MVILNLITALVAVIGVVFALYQFYQQTRSLRIKNLNETWRKFYDTKEFMELFSLMDDESKLNELAQRPSDLKLRFLAFLAEVVTLAENKGIEKDQTMYLFQWHFYYVFNNENTRTAFWKNILPAQESAENEVTKPYWRKYKQFADECDKRYPEDKKIS